ncbi:MAG: type II toxin-antitoxin system VapC family toxin [Thermoplasmataceae archaeon]
MKICDLLVVLDTNVIIDYLIGKEDVVREINSYRKDELSTTFVNVYELLKNASRKIMEDVIQNLRVYQSNELSEREAANAYHELRSIGKMMSVSDLMIFGICVANDEVLITQDKAFAYLRSTNVKIMK